MSNGDCVLINCGYIQKAASLVDNKKTRREANRELPETFIQSVATYSRQHKSAVVQIPLYTQVTQ